MSNEVDRVLGLPELQSYPQVPLPKPLKDRDLLPVQRAALIEMAVAEGFFGNLPVGTGKTLIALLAPLMVSAKRPLLLIEANYRPELDRQIAEWGEHFSLPKLDVLTYETLSSPNSRKLLFKIEPDFIMADEGHNLKHLSSVRTKRVIEYMSERPTTKFGVMSGTMTSRSIKEYAHLMEMALGDGAPIPLDLVTLGRWSRTIDPWSAALAMDPPRPADWASVSELVGWYAERLGYDRGEVIQKWRKQLDKDRREDAREALYERMRLTPGVMLEESGSFDGALNVYLIDIEVPMSVREATKEALAQNTVLDAHRHAATLSQGFYYEWDWPDGVPDNLWLLTRRNYGLAVQAVMEEDPDADSPALAARAILEGEEYEHLRGIVEAWELVKDRQPPTKTIWVSQFLLDDAVKRAAKLGKALIWYEHRAVAEALRARNIKVFGEGDGLPSGDVVALSRHVYGTGWNLQEWSKQIILQPPGNGRTMEQLLGRLHRRGQTGDSVDTYIYQHAEALRKFWEQASRDARYIQQTQGTQTKMSVATVVHLDERT